ncbi:hypothetical protein, partial [Salmonella sp. s51228]|uniref:hypothetical protein n=1 Tax=Salmonella sp. s51228 TaxID=3159652 RepID=UPI003980CC2F
MMSNGTVKTKELEASLYFTNLNQCVLNGPLDPTEYYIVSIGCSIYQVIGNYAVIEVRWDIADEFEDDTIESWTFNGEEIVFSNQIETIEIGGESY